MSGQTDTLWNTPRAGMGPTGDTRLIGLSFDFSDQDT